MHWLYIVFFLELEIKKSRTISYEGTWNRFPRHIYHAVPVLAARRFEKRIDGLIDAHLGDAVTLPVYRTPAVPNNHEQFTTSTFKMPNCVKINEDSTGSPLPIKKELRVENFSDNNT